MVVQQLNAANLSDNRWHCDSNDEYVYSMYADPDKEDSVYAANAKHMDQPVPSSDCISSFDAISAV